MVSMQGSYNKPGSRARRSVGTITCEDKHVHPAHRRDRSFNILSAAVALDKYPPVSGFSRFAVVFLLNRKNATRSIDEVADKSCARRLTAGNVLFYSTRVPRKTS